MESITELRVRYAETDQMGIVHHSNYVIWMELGRSDYLRMLGQSYSEWEALGIRLVVAGLELTYRGPSFYDELIQIRTTLKEATRRKIVFGYRVMRKDALLVEGESRHLVAGTDGKARTLPEELLAWVQKG
jgi:acyl-CoA thioester hydrolase